MTPGVVVDGEVVTTRLTDINIGLEEFVEHSYYEECSDHHFPTDPSGNPISPFHPWNKRTLPKPSAKSQERDARGRLRMEHPAALERLRAQPVAPTTCCGRC